MYLKALIYGDYGMGKTFLAGTSVGVPEMRDVLLINAESGDLTLDSDAYPFHLIDSVRVKDYKTVGRVFDYLKLHCALRDKVGPEADQKLRELEALHKGVEASSIKVPRRYRTVIIDSLTEVEVYCMNQLLGVSDATRLDEEVAGAEWAEYKRNHGMVQRMIRNFRDLPMHVIMTCARNYVQDDQKRFSYSPAMTGKLSSQVQGFMDLVGYLVSLQATEDGQPNPRRLFVQPGPRHSAKCRFSRFKGNYFDNPSIGGILKTVGLLGSTTPVKPVGGK